MNVFGEYLKGRPDAGAEWDNTMAGIQVCRFSLEVPEGQPPLQLPLTLGALHFEALFCRGGGVVLDDGLFLACESTLQHKAVMRSNFSSAVAGGEGLFNLSLNGSGVFCIESSCPREELIEVTLQNDVLKVDGNYAIAWSRSLEFTVERSGKSLIGSAASGEGLVNVYRGSGKVLMMPTAKMPNI